MNRRNNFVDQVAPAPRAIRATRVLHPRSACAWCGSPRGLLKVTRAQAVVCQDPVACARRQLRKALERA